MKTNKFAVWDNCEKAWTNFKMQDNDFYFLDQKTKSWLKQDPTDPEKRFLVCQYIGFDTDSSIPIYEGDALRISLKDNAEDLIKKEYGDFDEFTMPEELLDLKERIVIVNSIDGEYCFCEVPTYLWPISARWHKYLNIERVGNIFETSEILLMKTKKEKFCSF